MYPGYQTIKSGYLVSESDPNFGQRIFFQVNCPDFLLKLERLMRLFLVEDDLAPISPQLWGEAVPPILSMQKSKRPPYSGLIRGTLFSRPRFLQYIILQFESKTRDQVPPWAGQGVPEILAE